jgi:hypothetical protein
VLQEFSLNHFSAALWTLLDFTHDSSQITDNAFQDIRLSQTIAEGL